MAEFRRDTPDRPEMRGIPNAAARLERVGERPFCIDQERGIGEAGDLESDMKRRRNPGASPRKQQQ
jgi:hypothetical protein